MNDFVTRGTQNLTQVSVETQTDPRSGGMTTIVAYGFSSIPLVAPNDMMANALYLRNNGWIVHIKNTQQGGKWEMTATYNADILLDPTDTWIPNPIWEIDVHQIEKNLLEITDRSLVSNLSTATKQNIEYYLKNTPTSPVTGAMLTSDTTQQANALAVYTLMVTGVDYRAMFTKSIKRTLIASNRYNPNWLQTYDDMILSKSFLIGTYYVPLIQAALLPNGDTNIQTDTNGITTFQGYLQYPAIAVSIPPNKVQYSQTWVYNRWSAGSKGLYDVVGIQG